MRRYRSFTLVEILLVVIVLSILATIGLPMFTKAVERTNNRQATGMIQLILTGEKMYQAETGTFIGCSSTDDCASILRIDLPRNKWIYTVTSVSETGGTIKATRGSASGSGAGVGGRYLQLDFEVTTPVDAVPVCMPATDPYCK